MKRKRQVYVLVCCWQEREKERREVEMTDVFDSFGGAGFI